MRQETEKLRAFDDKIQIIHNGKEFRPYDEFSHIIIDLEIDDDAAAEDPEIEEAGYLLSIKRIYGSVQTGEADPSLTFTAHIDTDLANDWRISTSRIKRISNTIFPHEVEINLDTKEIHVLFDIYS
jgi:hypothetical protein